MNNLKIRKKIQVDFTPDQWDLYTELMDCQPAVDVLNQSLEDLVNLGKDKNTVMDKMMEKMKEFSQYGAYDSEPIYFLQCALEEIYG